MSNPKDDKNFTPNQVGTLVESFRNDIRAIAEDLGSVKEDVAVIKNEMVEVKTRLTSIEDAVRLSLPRISKLEVKVGA